MEDNKYTVYVRIPIPETSGRTKLFKYKHLVNDYIELMIKMYKKDNRIIRHRNSSEGYDNIYGKYFEERLELYKKYGQTKNERVIWLEF